MMQATAVKFDPSKHARGIHGRFAMAAAPTRAQAVAGNYQKGHARIGGLDISIENPAGSVRTKVGYGGKKWSVRMPAHYGYIRGTEGADGDHVDTYVGPAAQDAENLPVHVVDQVHTHNGAFDEHKVLMGFPTKTDALGAYDAAFSDGSGPRRRGAVTTMTFGGFKDWLKSGNTKMALSHNLRPPSMGGKPASPRMMSEGAMRATILRSGPPSFSSKPLVEEGVPRRSATKGESWQRNGRLYAPAAEEIPQGYTGSRQKEHEAGTMLEHRFTPQIPKSMGVEKWQGLMRQLGGVANDGMKGAIDKVTTEGIKVPTHKFSGPKHMTWMPPEGTTKQSLVRAYVHASKLALHDFGVGDYHFAMDDHLKAEMKPLEPFMRYARRKTVNDMAVAAPGKWRPFRAEFGQPFPSPKYDKNTGEERRRMRPNQVLVKMAQAGGVKHFAAENRGHGHVFPRPDGMKARCMGERRCPRCQADAAHKARGGTSSLDTY